MSKDKLALLGGAPVGDMSPPGPYPRFTQEAVDRVTELMQRGATVGLNKHNPEIAELEAAVAEWQGVAYCLGTSSGHAALQSALIGLEVSWGDEVITTPYTWGASTSCILHNSAIPVFADVDPETGLLDPASIEACITPRTKAILVVHIYGQPANMTAIRALADKHGLSVVEDGSQAHGAVHRGKKVGQYADAAGFSCMGGKLLASSEAGYMITPHEDVYWKAAMGGQHMGRAPEGNMPDELRPYVDSLVYTYRLNPVNAVLLTEQIVKIDAENEARRVNVSMLRTAMEDVQSVTFPNYPEGDLPSYHMLTMNFQPEVAGVSRSTYLEALRAEGVPAFSYVPSPISQWKRLQWQDYDGPKVMWTESLRQAGIDYSQVEVPNAERKIERSIEISWNYIDVDEAKMSRMAAAFEKVEANLDALREWEQAQCS